MMVFEHSMLRRIYGAVWDDDVAAWRMRHNAELRELSQLPPITNFIRSQRLRWAGHVARKDDNDIIKRVAQGRPEGHRPPGRPRLRWTDTIKKDQQQLEVQDPENW